MLATLGFVFAGYLILAGLDYGVALTGRSRADLDRLAPFFLGNEVWLVAAVGIMFGAFPLNEGELLSTYRAPVAVALLGVVIVTATYGLRLFVRGRWLDHVARIGAALATLGWGAALGAIVQGGAFRLTVTVVGFAIGLTLLLAVHGWAFLGHRWPVLGATSALIAAVTLWAGSRVDWIPGGSSLIPIVAYTVIPVVIAVQVTSWWLFRSTLGKPTPQHP